MVSDATLWLTFEKLPLAKLWNSIKEECPQLSKMAIKIFPAPYICLCEAQFTSNTSAKITPLQFGWWSRNESSYLQLNQVLKRFKKMKNNTTFSTDIFGGKYSFFSLKVLCSEVMHLLLLLSELIHDKCKIFLNFHFWYGQYRRHNIYKALLR